jgi:hypothetical protein
MGMFEYYPTKIVSILNLPKEAEKQFYKDFHNETSAIYIAYQRGKNMAELQYDTELHKHAKNGDVKAIELIMKRKAKNERLAIYEKYIEIGG